MLLLDIHAHLDIVKDLDKVIINAKKAGVKIICTAGLNPQTNRISLEIAERFDIVKCALGIYPPDALATEIDKPNDFDLDKEIAFLRKEKNNPKFIAIGECGLDYKTGKDKAMQKKVFEAMIDLSKELHKPFIVHSRHAEQDVIDILIAAHAKKVVMHCFCGTLAQVKQGAKQGWSFSIPCTVLTNKHFQDMVKEVNINQLFTETDAPFLSAKKGSQNEPAFVAASIKKIAELKGMDAEEVANNIFMNYLNMSGL